MRFSIAALAACAGVAHAFKDTSPFLLFSSSPLPAELKSAELAQLQSSSAVLNSAKHFLKNCPSELYYIITQPSLTSTDISHPDSIPHLKHALTNPGVNGRYAVSEVAGLKNVSAKDLVEVIDRQCGGVLGFDAVRDSTWREVLRTGKKVVVTTTLEDLPATERRGEVLADNDAKLYTPLADLAKGYHYTVIYLTTAPSTPIQPSSESLIYQSAFENLEHLDLKRDLKTRIPKGTEAADLLPLFEKYQFLTPGLFMGLLVGLILISILSVGISAIGSLQVSYGAFDKEMGPAAQKKQQ